MILKIFEILGLALFSGVKFLFAPAAIYIAGYSFIQAVIISTIGGIAGVFFFFKLGKSVFSWYNNRFHPTRKPKKFSYMNRVLVKVRARYGLIGLSVITPCIISIPIGSVIASRYYGYDHRTIWYLCLSVFIWSIILNGLTYAIGPVVG